MLSGERKLLDELLEPSAEDIAQIDRGLPKLMKETEELGLMPGQRVAET